MKELKELSTKEKVEVMQAWLDGKKIQATTGQYNDIWKDYPEGKEPSWAWTKTHYRIKPDEPEYLPYRNADEFLLDMACNGRLYYNTGGGWLPVKFESITNDGILVMIGEAKCYYTYPELLQCDAMHNDTLCFTNNTVKGLGIRNPKYND